MTSHFKTLQQDLFGTLTWPPLFRTTTWPRDVIWKRSLTEMDLDRPTKFNKSRLLKNVPNTISQSTFCVHFDALNSISFRKKARINARNQRFLNERGVWKFLTWESWSRCLSSSSLLFFSSVSCFCRTVFTDLQAATKRKAKRKTFSMTSCCLQKSEVKNYNEMNCTWVDATFNFFPPLACFPALCRVAYCKFSRAFNQLFFSALGSGWPNATFPALSTS